MNQVSKFLKKEQRLFIISPEQRVSLAIPFQHGNIVTTFEKYSLTEFRAEVCPTLEFQMGNITIKSSNDYPSSIHFISHQLFPFFKFSSSLFNTTPISFESKFSYSTEVGSYLIKSNMGIKILGLPFLNHPNSIDNRNHNENSPLENETKSSFDLKNSIKLIGNSHSFVFKSFRLAKIITFDFFYHDRIKTGINMTYDLKEMQFRDTILAYSRQTFAKCNLTLSASLLGRSIKASLTRKFSNPSKGKAGLYFESQNMGKNVDYIGKFSSKFHIDEETTIKTILSSDLSFSSHFHMTYQKFLDMDFYASIGNKKQNFGAVFNFNLLDQ